MGFRYLGQTRVLGGVLGLNQQSYPYTVGDEFLGELAAGSVDGTSANVGTRQIVDTGGNISVSGGALVFAGGAADWTGTLYYLEPALTRAYGVAGVWKVSPTAVNETFAVGWRENTGATFYGVQFDDDGLLYILNDQAPDAPGVAVGAYGVADYEIMAVLRTAGLFLFIKGGAFTDWTLLFNTLTGNDASLYAAIANYNAVFEADYVRVPVAAQSVAPLASDSFNRASVGSTDGAGHPEANGGSGLAWTAQQTSTWGITSNKLRATALGTDSAAIITVNTGAADVVIEALVETTGGFAGVALRYVDDDNYIRAVVTPLSGGLCRLFKTVAGTETQVFSAAITYVDGSRLLVTAEGSAFRVYYNGALINTGTIADAAVQSSTLHGGWLNSVGSVVNLDNLVIWARN